MSKLAIIGAGSLSRVVFEAALENNIQVVGFFDDQLPIGQTVIDGYKVLGKTAELVRFSKEITGYVVAIGNGEVKAAICQQYGKEIKSISVIHPNAVVSDSAKLDEGVIVLAGAVINAGATIGCHSLINSNSLVDHDTRIGSFCHIAQGAIVGSNVHIPNVTSLSLGQHIPSFTKI